MPLLPNNAFFRDAISIDVQEYQSTSVTTTSQRAKQVKRTQIKFSFFRLSVATAKSILTRNPTDLDLLKEVRAAFYTLDSMVAYPSLNLRVCEGFRKKYRDFSKTGRVGELAQALTFLFAQEHLGFPLVIDFDGYLASQTLPPMEADQQTPDFALIFKNGVKQPSLIESKGACPGKDSLSVKAKLREALDQCDAADGHIFACATPQYNIKNSYGTFVRLAESTDAWESVLCFCDPSNDVAEGMVFPLDAARRYYAAWLTLSGHIDLARALVNNELHSDTVQRWEVIDAAGVKFSVPSSPVGPFNLFTPYMGFKRTWPLTNGHSSVWAIQTDLISALVNNDERIFRDFFAQPMGAYTDFNSGNIYFADRTLFQVRWDS